MPIDPEFLLAFIRLLEEITIHEEGSFSGETSIEEEMNIDVERDLPRIINKINSVYEINLEVSEILEDNDIETIEDLAKIVFEEVDLG